jgi:hypothetical protein
MPQDYICLRLPSGINKALLQILELGMSGIFGSLKRDRRLDKRKGIQNMQQQKRRTGGPRSVHRFLDDLCTGRCRIERDQNSHGFYLLPDPSLLERDLLLVQTGPVGCDVRHSHI